MTVEQMIGVFGIAVAVLSILFTGGGILGAFVIYRQGQDYKKSMDDAITQIKTRSEVELERYTTVIDEYMVIKNAELESSKQSLLTTADSLTASLRTAREENRGAIRKEIEQVQRALEVLPKPLAIPTWAQVAASHAERAHYVVIFEPALESPEAESVSSALMAIAGIDSMALSSTQPGRSFQFSTAPDRAAALEAYLKIVGGATRRVAMSRNGALYYERRAKT
jgi:hypothetical protein